MTSAVVYLNGRMEFGDSLTDRRVGVRPAIEADSASASALLAQSVRSGQFYWSHGEFSPNGVGAVEVSGDFAEACSKLLAVSLDGKSIGFVAGSEIGQRRWALHWWDSIDGTTEQQKLTLQAVAAYLDDVECVGRIETSVPRSRQDHLSMLQTLGLHVLSAAS